MSRINISYSIEMEELDSEIGRLIARSQETLQAATIEFIRVADQESYLDVSTYESIDDLRQSLAQVDHALNDINSIINSYNIYQLNQLNGSSPQPNEEHHAEPSQV